MSLETDEARLALWVAWCGRVDDHAVYGERRYLPGAGEERLGEEEAVAWLASLPRPLRLDALVDRDALRVHATPILPDTPEHRAFQDEWLAGRGVAALAPEEDPDLPSVLVYCAGSTQRVSPRLLERFNGDFWVGVPALFAGDLIGSSLVSELGLAPEELDGVVEVLLLGRVAEDGAVAPIRPPRDA